MEEHIAWLGLAIITAGTLSGGGLQWMNVDVSGPGSIGASLIVFEAVAVGLFLSVAGALISVKGRRGRPTARQRQGVLTAIALLWFASAIGWGLVRLWLLSENFYPL